MKYKANPTVSIGDRVLDCEEVNVEFGKALNPGLPDAFEDLLMSDIEAELDEIEDFEDSLSGWGSPSYSHIVRSGDPFVYTHEDEVDGQRRRTMERMERKERSRDPFLYMPPNRPRKPSLIEVGIDLPQNAFSNSRRLIEGAMITLSFAAGWMWHEVHNILQ